MDKSRVSIDTDKKGDINIFLFSNGQVFSPPRKYHLKGEELSFWDSTKNYLARSHFGYMHSTIDLYTTDGRKIYDPIQLYNNNAYVAVEPNEGFLPGGYDQYLMKASKSWIKRYGDTNMADASKEKQNTNAVKISESSTNNSTDDKIRKMENSAKEIPEDELLGPTEIKYSGKKPTTIPQKTIPHTNTSSQKQIVKKRYSTPRSSILKKNNIPSQPNDKKPSPPPSPLKNRSSSQQKKVPSNKIPPQNPKKESGQFKTLLSAAKSRNISSQLAFNNTPTSTTYVTPAFIIPAKLPIKREIQNSQPESSQNEDKAPQQDIVLQKEATSTNEDTKTQENTKITEHDSGQKDFETLETIIENDNSNYNIDFSTNGTGSKVIEPFYTSVNVGDVINLRLSIELKKLTNDAPTKNKGNASVSIPWTYKKYWNGPTEKSSQVNMDEMEAQNETINVIDDLNKNEQKYIIFNCDCCHSHENTKLPVEMLNYQVKNINNKDYILLLPSTKNDVDLLRCKCNDEPKLDKYVQTSIIIENTECLNIASAIKTVDESTHADKTSIDVLNVSQHQSQVTVIKPVGTKSSRIENPLPLKENRISNDINKSNSTYTEKINNQAICTVIPVENDTNLNDTSSNENKIDTQLNDSTNILKEIVTLDKTTQTDSHCFLLEAKRQKDGHFSFHLPPLHMVKLYQI